METRECGVCGEDVLGRDFVQTGPIRFCLAGDREDPSFFARGGDNDEEPPEDYAEYFCRGCIGSFEEGVWMVIDKARESGRCN